ncbi:type VI secretion system protein TssA [Salmonella enterica]|nr:type VI secretion system protein TssA [Salmonella enterica]EBP7909020.1 type VI secretion system protein TssA [Salmonella enterica]EDR2627279.1 type VI secretion system protein TssA [Salmonella enterica subsp. enterica serovar Thompson]
MSELLQQLTRSCFTDRDVMAVARAQAELWQNWLLPVTDDAPVGDDPGYHDDFLLMRDEMNKISGANTDLICQLAESLLLAQAKDVRIATYYIWARLHRDGERGLADGLALLAGLVDRFGTQLLPSRPASRKMALEWLAGEKILDSLARHPEVVKDDFMDIVAALNLLAASFVTWPEAQQPPSLMPLVSALESRLAQSGGMNAVVPQNSSGNSALSPTSSTGAPQVQAISSGRDLLDQAKVLARYLNEQPQGWLAAHRLMTSLRWDTVHELPPDADGKTRLAPPRTESRNQLKRLYAQQNWTELLEQADRMFSEGVCHFWLDIQWYLHQALGKAGAPWDKWTAVIRQDLALLLERLPGLESLAWNDGTPFADEVTRNWITQQVLQQNEGAWLTETSTTLAGNAENDVLALEQEALEMADSQSVDAALGWLQARPGIISARQRLLLRLLMSRVAEQFGKNEMALLLLEELDGTAQGLTLTEWEPELLFEVKARQLKLLRLRAHRHADKAALARKMETLLGELVAIDPARAAVLCDTQHKD